MTVSELIKKLEEIEDKTVQVRVVTQKGPEDAKWWYHFRVYPHQLTIG